MGQKANLITLRQSFVNLNLQTQQPKLFLFGMLFILAVKKLALKKNIVLSKHILNFVGNKLFLNLMFFFKTAKVFFYKKKKFKKNINKIKSANKNLHIVFSKLLFKQLNFVKTNLIIFSIRVLNKEFNLKINKLLLTFFFKKTKPFLNILFQRRFTLFFDFLKQTVLLMQNLLDVKSFLQIICQIFKHLHKKGHTKFFVFFNLISNLIVNFNLMKKTQYSSQIKGLKLLIKGRLQGKMRASSKYLIEGTIPAQNLNKNIEYATQGVSTIYGVYGLTL
jgi:hypothetical protein